MAAAAVVRRRLYHFSPFPTLITLIDNEAARGAINAGSSGSSPMRPLLHDFFEESCQHLAVRVSTECNTWADQLSRGAERDVLASASAAGLATESLAPLRGEWGSLRASLRLLGAA